MLTVMTGGTATPVPLLRVTAPKVPTAAVEPRLSVTETDGLTVRLPAVASAD